MSASKIKAKRRAQLEESWSAASEDDRKFFEANPSRSTRIRYTTEGEQKLRELEFGRACPASPGMSWYTLTRQAVPGVRVRLFITFWAEAGTDVEEQLAAEIYDATAAAQDPRVVAFEHGVRDQLSANGRSIH